MTKTQEEIKKIIIFHNAYADFDFIGVYDDEEVAQANLLESLSDELPNYTFWIKESSVFASIIDANDKDLKVFSSDVMNIGSIWVYDYIPNTIQKLRYF